MIRKLLAGLGLATLTALPVQATTNVGISIGIGGPGQYGRIDINNYPQPQVVMPQPVLVLPSPVAVVRQPIYLYVPPAHRDDWAHQCGRYNACAQPVYFVREDWVRQQRRGHWKDEGRHDNGRGHGHGRGRGHDRD